MPFSRSAHIYDDIYQKIRDYKAQAEQINKWTKERKLDSRRLLDVACGTGLHLSYLRSSYDVEGVDVCSAMVEIARSRNPGIPLYVGDMQDFNLQKLFDVITCMFSSITYVETVEALNATLLNFARHLEPRGICIIEPFISLESWCDGGLGFRMVESGNKKIAMVDRAERTRRRVRREIAYIIATSERLEQIYEEHVFTLFTRVEYENAFRNAGFDIEYEENLFTEGRGMYIGILRDYL